MVLSSQGRACSAPTGAGRRSGRRGFGHDNLGRLALTVIRPAPVVVFGRRVVPAVVQYPGYILRFLLALLILFATHRTKYLMFSRAPPSCDNFDLYSAKDLGRFVATPAQLCNYPRSNAQQVIIVDLGGDDAHDAIRGPPRHAGRAASDAPSPEWSDLVPCSFDLRLRQLTAHDSDIYRRI